MQNDPDIHHTVGVTKFADQTEEEMQSKLFVTQNANLSKSKMISKKFPHRILTIWTGSVKVQLRFLRVLIGGSSKQLLQSRTRATVVRAGLSPPQPMDSPGLLLISQPTWILTSLSSTCFRALLSAAAKEATWSTFSRRPQEGFPPKHSILTPLTCPPIPSSVGQAPRLILDTSQSSIMISKMTSWRSCSWQAQWQYRSAQQTGSHIEEEFSGASHSTRSITLCYLSGTLRATGSSRISGAQSGASKGSFVWPLTLCTTAR